MAHVNSDRQEDPNWPGLVADRDGVAYSADGLKKIAADLLDALSKLTGGKSGLGTSARGSVPDLHLNTDLSLLINEIRHVRDWPGGYAFADALEAGQKEILVVYTQVNDTLEIAYKLILQGAGNYTIANLVNES